MIKFSSGDKVIEEDDVYLDVKIFTKESFNQNMEAEYL